ncbi:hypothetical protein ACOME3_008689 [Neoechinorhynchus agilis]
MDVDDVKDEPAAVRVNSSMDGMVASSTSAITRSQKAKEVRAEKRRFQVDLSINDYLRHIRARGLEGDGYFGEYNVVSDGVISMRNRVSDAFDRTVVKTIQLSMATRNPRRKGMAATAATAAVNEPTGSICCRVVCKSVSFNDVDASLERLLMAIVRSVLSDRANSEYWLDVTVILNETDDRQFLVKVTLPFFHPDSGCVHVRVRPLECSMASKDAEMPCRGNYKGHRCRIGFIQGQKFHAHYRRKIEEKKSERHRQKANVQCDEDNHHQSAISNRFEYMIIRGSLRNCFLLTRHNLSLILVFRNGVENLIYPEHSKSRQSWQLAQFPRNHIYLSTSD